MKRKMKIGNQKVTKTILCLIKLDCFVSMNKKKNKYKKLILIVLKKEEEIESFADKKKIMQRKSIELDITTQMPREE